MTGPGAFRLTGRAGRVVPLKTVRAVGQRREERARRLKQGGTACLETVTPLAFLTGWGRFRLGRGRRGLKLRYIPYILLEIVLGVIALGITRLLVEVGVPRIPKAVWELCDRSGIAYVVVNSGLQILSYGLFLIVFGMIHKACHSLLTQDSPQNAPQGRRTRERTLPIQQNVPAEVCGKRVKSKRAPREKRPTIRYFAGFRVDGGEELWFQVCEEEYRRLSEGNQGQLAFQGKSYLSFQKNGEGAYKNAE